MTTRQYPLVSIITPAYNQAEYLDATIQSVLAQTYPNLEYIVLDDGSSDRTPEVLKKYDGQLRWERHENMGQARTLNKGWRMSNGELLAYLSSDDLLDPRAIERLVEEYDGQDSVIFGAYRLIDQNGATIKTKNTVFLGYADMVHNFNCPIGPGAIFSRSLFESSGGWNTELRQIPDYDFWIRIGARAKFIRVDEELAGFRVHTGSQTFAQSSIQKSDESIASMADLFEKMMATPGLSRTKAMAAAYVYSACLHLRSGRYGTSVNRLVDSLRFGGAHALSLRNLKRVAGTLFSMFRYYRIK
ncbi:glycosyltransferase [Massilia sp. R2A-15]|uniref:glycosyltransferase n=1 Tax=Massilia sp. R2A-15 TaxID=3064278 RepID=UPI002736BCAE|nr:glycosyltransferase [Massilia sp. R2A-15]WLI88044.1 glycosyltransferase [Massilia sp. R2A-15]